MRNLTRSQRSAVSTRPSTSPKTKQVSLKYHGLRCQICKHACRQQIEEAFLQWRSPKAIMHCFGTKTETTIYYHAHALGLFSRRNQNLSQALANIIEEVDTVRPTTRDILRAVYALAHINDQGHWIGPTNKSEVVVSSKRAPSAPSKSSADPASAPSRRPPLITRHCLNQSLAK
jgi:hypothetical protein